MSMEPNDRKYPQSTPASTPPPSSSEVLGYDLWLVKNKRTYAKDRIQFHSLRDLRLPNRD